MEKIVVSASLLKQEGIEVSSEDEIYKVVDRLKILDNENESNKNY